jgi:hypothetical protein
MTTCIFTVIKNEHLYLDEWIQYHLNLGVQHIFLLEDFDSKTHKEITDKYQGFVTLLTVSDITAIYKPQLYKNAGLNLQRPYTVAGVNYIKNHFKYDWCFIIDADEFLTLENSGDTLENVMNQYASYNAVVLQWENYGASGLKYAPDYTKTTIRDTFTEKCPLRDRPDATTKVCYKLEFFDNSKYFNQHIVKSTDNWCKTDFSKSEEPIYKNIYIRHYITKSWEEYFIKSKIRGTFSLNLRTYDYFFKLNPNMLPQKDELIREFEQKYKIPPVR